MKLLLVFTNVFEDAKRVGVFAALLQYFYSSVSQKIKIVPGIDQRSGFQAAMAIEGCRIVLGDRPLRITLSRTWASLTSYEKLKFGVWIILSSFREITEKDVELMKESDILTTVIEELSNQFPGILRALVYERDEYLAHVLTQLPGPVCCAVVGLGHVEGIKRNWERRIELKKIMEIPQASPNEKFEILLIVYLFFQNAYIIFRMVGWLFL